MDKAHVHLIKKKHTCKWSHLIYVKAATTDHMEIKVSVVFIALVQIYYTWFYWDMIDVQ